MYKQNTCNYGTAILLSLILGVGVAILFAQGFITSIVTGLWIAFGIAAAILLTFTILVSVLCVKPFICFKKALQLFGKNVIIGSIGTLVTTLAALSITLIPAATVSLIFVFFAALFLTFTLVSLVQMLFFLICQDVCCH